MALFILSGGTRNSFSFHGALKKVIGKHWAKGSGKFSMKLVAYMTLSNFGALPSNGANSPQLSFGILAEKSC